MSARTPASAKRALMNTVGPWNRLARARTWRASARGRIFRSLSLGDGRRHGILGVSWALALISFSPPVCRRYVGFPRHHFHLVGQLASRVHVLQSVLVARAFGICGFAVCFLLAPHA